jgi:hypothetical protein
MTQHEAPHNAKSSYRYLHLTPEELAHLPPDELLEACLEYRSFMQTMQGILSTPDVTLTERVVASDLLYTQALRLAKEPSSAHAEQVVSAIKEVSDRLGLRPSAVRTAYEQLAKRGAVRIDDRSLPQRRHQLSLPLDSGTSADKRRK